MIVADQQAAHALSLTGEDHLWGFRGGSVPRASVAPLARSEAAGGSRSRCGGRATAGARASSRKSKSDRPPRRRGSPPPEPTTPLLHLTGLAIRSPSPNRCLVPAPARASDTRTRRSRRHPASSLAPSLPRPHGEPPPHTSRGTTAVLADLSPLVVAAARRPGPRRGTRLDRLLETHPPHPLA